MKFFLLVISLVSSTVYSQTHQFQHLKLKGLLKEQNLIGHMVESKSFKQKNNKAVATQKQIYSKIFGAEKVSESLLKAKDEPDSPFENSLLFEKITQMLQGNYEEIGRAQAQTLLNHHQDFGGGVKNFSGFSWEKPAGTFSIGVNRQLSPDLFDSERWIVHDTLVIHIDAATFLNKLKEAQLIDIDTAQLRAYAGIQWQRVYTTYHFASSFQDGILADFKKLFMPFLAFDPKNVVKLPQDEIIMKEDYFTTYAGGIVTAPAFYAFSFSGGAHVEYSKMSKVSVHSLGMNDPKKPGEIIRVSAEKQESKAVGVSASLQVDFFNLLKLTILSYDLEYQYKNASKQDLSFFDKDVNDIISSNEFGEEFKKLLKGKFVDIDYFKERIVQHEQRLNENLSSKYGVLLLSKMKQSETEFVRIIKKNSSKTFYRHHSESMKVVQSLVSKIFNVIINRILDFDVGVKNMSTASKSLDIEYESSSDENDMIVDDEEKFSVLITHQYQASNTHKKIHKFYNKKARYYLSQITPISNEMNPLVKTHKLRGPLKIVSSIRITKDGLKHFHEQSEDEIYYLIAKNCNLSEEKSQEMKRADYRARKLRRWQAGKMACVKHSGNKYKDYMNDIKERGIMNLEKLKTFLAKFYKKNDNYRYFLGLFGKDKVFVHGEFSAKTSEGRPFSTFFQNGEFQGMGVIDNYRLAP